MNEINSPPRTWRSIGAVFTGLLAIVVLSMGTDTILHASGIYPPWFQPMATHLWLVALAHRIAFGVLGAYLTARLAPRNPMRHAMILAAIGIVLSTVGVAVNWNKGAEYGPIWFNLSLIAISLPCSWMGGRLREMQLMEPSNARSSAAQTHEGVHP